MRHQLQPPASVAALIGTLMRDPYGILLLVNAVDSVVERLVGPDLIRNLLSDLDDEVISNPGSRWPGALARVCHGKSEKSRRKGGYLRAADASKDTAHVTETWSTIVSEAVWSTKHLDASKKKSAPLPPFPFPGAPNAAFEKKFKALIAEPDWYQQPTTTGGAWLGRPALEGANCWVSCDDLDSDYSVPGKSLKGPARRVVEALGLLPKSPFDHYVRYVIDVAIARSSTSGDARRPCVADQGNEWFRVLSTTPRATHYGGHGWGATVNLSATRAGLSDDTGRPERVTASIPIRRELLRDVEVLYPSPADRRFASAPKEHFRQALLRGRSESDIEAALLSLWDVVPPSGS